MFYCHERGLINERRMNVDLMSIRGNFYEHRLDGTVGADMMIRWRGCS